MFLCLLILVFISKINHSCPIKDLWKIENENNNALKTKGYNAYKIIGMVEVYPGVSKKTLFLILLKSVGEVSGNPCLIFTVENKVNTENC